MQTSPSQQKIGIYPGSFDPIHAGHMAFAQTALKKCNLDKVFFLVEPEPRHKQAVKPVEHRQLMVEAAIANDKLLGSIHVQDERFTVHKTLPRLKQRLHGSKLYMLMGDDVALHLSAWPHINELQDVEFIIAIRKSNKEHMQSVMETLQKVKGTKLNYSFVTLPEHTKISSTAIRRSYKQGREPKDVPATVSDYIARHKLYS